MKINVYYKTGKVMYFATKEVHTEAGKLHYKLGENEHFIRLSEVASFSITPQPEDIEGPEVIL